MTHEQLERFFRVVDSARRGDEAAKLTLLVILETERKPTILWKLRVKDVRPQDLADAHHDLEVKVYENIEELRVSKAYFAWEARIISGISRNVRDSYRVSGEPWTV